MIGTLLIWSAILGFALWLVIQRLAPIADEWLQRHPRYDEVYLNIKKLIDDCRCATLWGRDYVNVNMLGKSVYGRRGASIKTDETISIAQAKRLIEKSQSKNILLASV